MLPSMAASTACWKAELAWSDGDVPEGGAERMTWRVSWLMEKDAGHGMRLMVLGWM